MAAVDMSSVFAGDKRQIMRFEVVAMVWKQSARTCLQVARFGNKVRSLKGLSGVLQGAGDCMQFPTPGTLVPGWRILHEFDMRYSLADNLI